MLLAEGGYDYNREIIKYVLVAVTTPFWWPFVKAAWEELDDSLREEGGLFGDEPDSRELAELNLEKGIYESPMVSEPWDLPGTRGPRGLSNISSAGRGMLRQNVGAAAPRRGGAGRRRSGFARDDR